MRILLATMQLGQAYVHGTERYVETLGAELVRRKHEVVYLAGDPLGERRRGVVAAESFAGGRIHRIPTFGWATVQGYDPSQMAEWMRALALDVVHVAALAHVGLSPVLAARRLGIPVVATAMDYWWVCPRGTLLREGTSPCEGKPGWQECLACILSDHPRSAMQKASRVSAASSVVASSVLGLSAISRGAGLREATRWQSRRTILDATLREIDELIFPSAATLQAILGDGAKAGGNVHEIPYGLAPEWFEFPVERPSNGLAPQSLTWGFAGSLQRHKGPDLLLAAARELGWHETPIKIAGTSDDPDYREELGRAADGLCVEFTGALSPAQMRRFLRSIDVFVLPSCWPENLPFVLLEAQAAGLPVIASDVGGISHRIPDAHLLFEAGSVADLARAMRSLTLPAAPAPLVNSVSDMVDATEAVYLRALSRRAA
jgi:glycosyltransferase involved in cell wall biosynthesis